MADIFDYLTWRGDLSFSQSPLNEVDFLIFSKLSYFPLDGIVTAAFEDPIPLHRAVERYFESPAEVNNIVLLEEDLTFVRALADSNRFGALGLCGYVNHIDYDQQKQFSVLTIMVDENLCYISFRGTDNTLVGWKEDFNMSFMPVVPSQQEALEYFQQAADTLGTRFYLGGHSKGGNLAVYSSVFCPDGLKPRILGVYNHDGPGLYNSLRDNAQYQKIRDRIHTYVPQSSVIGMMLEHEENYTVVQSAGRGPAMQHELYSWNVLGTSFVYLDTVTSGSRFLNHTLKEWIGQLPLEQREHFFNALYDILTTTDARTIHEMDANWLKNMQTILDTYSKADKATKQLIEETLKSLLQTASKNIRIFR